MTDKQPELVMIEWLDAEGDVGWEAPKDDNDLPTCKSVGYVVRETDEFTVVAADYDATNGHFNRRMKIPLGMIKNIWPLRVGRATKMKKVKRG